MSAASGRSAPGGRNAYITGLRIHVAEKLRGRVNVAVVAELERGTPQRHATHDITAYEWAEVYRPMYEREAALRRWTLAVTEARRRPAPPAAVARETEHAVLARAGLA